MICFETCIYRDSETKKTELADLVLLLSDTVATLHTFLDIYPKAAIILSENDFIRRLVLTYNISNSFCTCMTLLHYFHLTTD